jgi:hypothetical protein
VHQKAWQQELDERAEKVKRKMVMWIPRWKPKTELLRKQCALRSQDLIDAFTPAHQRVCVCVCVCVRAHAQVCVGGLDVNKTISVSKIWIKFDSVDW